MSDKIKKLEIKKLLQEYNFLLIDDEYKREVIGDNRSEFLKSIEDKKKELGVSSPEPEIPTEPKDKVEKEPKIKNVNDHTKRKMKKIYRDIVKVTHPDKIDSEEMLDTYIKAKAAYSDNNLLELYMICVDLNIDVELEGEDVENIMEDILLKRKEMSDLETSFLWLWVHAPTQEIKDEVVLKFINKHVNIVK
jgi:hypothetical protein